MTAASTKTKKVLVIDNYDSFTYNLVQYFGELEAETKVYRNDEVSEAELSDLVADYSHILLSPGPGKPQDAGLCNYIVENFAGKIPILGVCLGHQVIAENFGASVCKAPYLMHGKTSEIYHDGEHAIFTDIPSPYTSTRYHSLVVDSFSVEAKGEFAKLREANKEALSKNKVSDSVSSKLKVEAYTQDGLIMAISHRDFPNLVGVQYHPESILSEHGHKLLNNFLTL